MICPIDNRQCFHEHCSPHAEKQKHCCHLLARMTGPQRAQFHQERDLKTRSAFVKGAFSEIAPIRQDYVRAKRDMIPAKLRAKGFDPGESVFPCTHDIHTCPRKTTCEFMKSCILEDEGVKSFPQAADLILRVTSMKQVVKVLELIKPKIGMWRPTKEKHFKKKK